MEILVDKDLWIKNFEEIASQYYTKSMKAKNISFILSNSVEKADSFSIMLLFGWILQLAQKGGKNIEFVYEADKINERLSKLLFGIGIINELKDRGINTKVKYHIVNPPNYPIKILNNSEEDLKIVIEEINNNFQTTPYAKFIVNDLTNIIIREIITNSFIHQSKYSYPFIFITDRRIESKGSNFYLNSYDAGDHLLEIHLGDIGKNGITTTLKDSIPTGWTSPLTNLKNVRPEEMVLLYAFDYSSTSNETLRKERIQRLLKDAGVEIQSNEVASGLYSMLGIVKRYGGQFILKSSGKVLAFDFNNAKNSLEVKGFKGTKYDIKKYSTINGTYIKVAIPINKGYNGSDKQETKVTLPISRSIVSIDYRSKQLTCKSENEFIPFLIKDFNATNFNNTKETILLLDIDLTRISSKGQQVIFIFLLNQYHNRINYFINSENYSHVSYYDKLNVFQENKLFVGNIDKNRFDVIGTSGENKVGIIASNDFSLRKDELYLIRSTLFNSWSTRLQDIVESEYAKRTDGPFLFEESHYYTKEFYQLDFLFENPTMVDFISSTITYYIILNQLSLVIFEARGFNKISSHIEDKLKLSGYYDIKIVSKGPFIISQTLDYRDKKAAVFTDVICTGKTIKEYIKNLAHINKLEIFTIIDGRPQKETFSFDFDDVHYAYKVTSVVHHFIKPYYEHPYSGEDKERIVVVNQDQKIPTIRERYMRPKDFEQEYESIQKAVTADSLIHGHIEFRDKHYSYYIHFPSYFKFIENDLKKWLSEQLDTLKTKLTKRKITVCQFEDISLKWLERFLLNEISDKEINFKKVNQIKLNRPEPESENESSDNSDWIAFLPAISSGDTQMKMIEWISRYKPKSIHMISFVSRMNWYTANFYSGITQYQNITFSLSYFTRFPISSHNKYSHDCPYCSQLNVLKKLNLDRYHKLKNLVQLRINKLNVININGTDADKLLELTAHLNEEDRNNLMLLIDIRVLYEPSIINHNIRKRLYKKLKYEDKAKLSFLENLSYEYSLPIFELNIIEDVLYDNKDDVDIFKLIQELCYKIIKNAPPFPIRKYLLGVEHLVPNILYDNIDTLLQNYSNSPKDFEEIILSILLLQKGPSLLTKLNAIEIVNKESKELLKEFLEYINDYILIPSEQRKNLELIQKIYAKIYRSSFPMISVKNLIFPDLEFSEEKWKGKLKDINEAYRNWMLSYEDWKPKLKNSPEVQVIDKYIISDKETNNSVGLEGILNEITTTMNQLTEDANKVTFPITTSQKDKLSLLIDRIDSYGKKINRILYHKFVVVPSKMNYREEIFKTKNLKHFKEFDNKIDRKIFFTEAQLQFIIDELLTNCEKSFTKNKGTYVKVTIKDDGEYIALEIEDDISDDFKMGGIGSLNSIKDYCTQFGSDFVIIPFDNGTGSKKIRLRLLKWPLAWEL